MKRMTTLDNAVSITLHGVASYIKQEQSSGPFGPHAKLAQIEIPPVFFEPHAPSAQKFEIRSIEIPCDFRCTDPMLPDANAGDYAV
jgi:hypothetical protein